MCLIWLLATPAFDGMGLFGSSATEDSVKPLLANTSLVYVASCPLPGTAKIFTVPIVLAFGEAPLLFGPAPRPRALDTYNVFPLLLTCTAAGHHPTGI